MNHIPVMTKEIIEGLDLKKGSKVLDGTLGAFGHGKEICKIIGKSGVYIGVDLDNKSVENAKKVCSETKPEANCKFFQGNFADLEEYARKSKIDKFDAVLLDLGWNSDQFEDAERGFSFKARGILNMRYDNNGRKLTAWDIVNTTDPESLITILRVYGDEKHSKLIVNRIMQNRPINTACHLADIIANAVHKYTKDSKIHPATKTFQAIRIATNDEFGSLNRFMKKFPDFLEVGGRLAVISFHSGEDRICKNAFRELAKKGGFEILTKKPITASEREIKNNPRSRSAKLRIIKKLKHDESR